MHGVELIFYPIFSLDSTAGQGGTRELQSGILGWFSKNGHPERSEGPRWRGELRYGRRDSSLRSE
jgi:hypothetical protein